MDEAKIQQLTRLGALRSSGALSEDEFAAQKSLILSEGKPALKPSGTEADLRKIEALRLSGALSDDEAAAEKSKLLRPKVAAPLNSGVEVGATAAQAPDVPTIPVWASKKKKKGAPVALFAAITIGMVVGGAAVLWFTNDRQGEVNNYVVTSLANVRTAPTTESSAVVETLSAGEIVSGQWVDGRNGSRWLKISDAPDSYVWEGNLRAH